MFLRKNEFPKLKFLAQWKNLDLRWGEISSMSFLLSKWSSVLGAPCLFFEINKFKHFDPFRVWHSAALMWTYIWSTFVNRDTGIYVFCVHIELWAHTHTWWRFLWQRKIIAKTYDSNICRVPLSTSKLFHHDLGRDELYGINLHIWFQIRVPRSNFSRMSKCVELKGVQGTEYMQAGLLWSTWDFWVCTSITFQKWIQDNCLRCLGLIRGVGTCRGWVG